MSPEREPGDIDGHGALRALRSAVGASAVVEGEAVIGRAAGGGCR